MFLLAIMLTGSFALANNVQPNVSSEIKEVTETFTSLISESPSGTCTVKVTGYNVKGEEVYSVTYVFHNVSSDECDAIFDSIVSEVRKNF